MLIMFELCEYMVLVNLLSVDENMFMCIISLMLSIQMCGIGKIICSF